MGNVLQKILRKRKYPLKHPQLPDLMQALRNCEINHLKRLLESATDHDLRCGALAVLRDLGSEARSAAPVVQQILDQPEYEVQQHSSSLIPTEQGADLDTSQHKELLLLANQAYFEIVSKV